MGFEKIFFQIYSVHQHKYYLNCNHFIFFFNLLKEKNIFTDFCGNITKLEIKKSTYELYNYTIKNIFILVPNFEKITKETKDIFNFFATEKKNKKILMRKNIRGQEGANGDFIELEEKDWIALVCIKIFEFLSKSNMYNFDSFNDKSEIKIDKILLEEDSNEIINKIIKLINSNISNTKKLEQSDRMINRYIKNCLDTLIASDDYDKVILNIGEDVEIINRYILDTKGTMLVKNITDMFNEIKDFCENKSFAFVKKIMFDEFIQQRIDKISKNCIILKDTDLLNIKKHEQVMMMYKENERDSFKYKQDKEERTYFDKRIKHYDNFMNNLNFIKNNIKNIKKYNFSQKSIGSVVKKYNKNEDEDENLNNIIASSMTEMYKKGYLVSLNIFLSQYILNKYGKDVFDNLTQNMVQLDNINIVETNFDKYTLWEYYNVKTNTRGVIKYSKNNPSLLTRLTHEASIYVELANEKNILPLIGCGYVQNKNMLNLIDMEQINLLNSHNYDNFFILTKKSEINLMKKQKIHTKKLEAYNIVIDNLVLLNKKYKFVHWDLKSDNIFLDMIDEKNLRFNFFDFDNASTQKNISFDILNTNLILLCKEFEKNPEKMYPKYGLTYGKLTIILNNIKQQLEQIQYINDSMNQIISLPIIFKDKIIPNYFNIKISDFGLLSDIIYLLISTQQITKDVPEIVQFHQTIGTNMLLLANMQLEITLLVIMNYNKIIYLIDNLFNIKFKGGHVHNDDYNKKYREKYLKYKSKYVKNKYNMIL